MKAPKFTEAQIAFVLNRAEDGTPVACGIGLDGRVGGKFLHVDACADELVFLLKDYSGHEHVNAGSGEDITILEPTMPVCEVVGFKGEIVHGLSKPDATPRKLMIAVKLCGMCWKPRIGLGEGVEVTYSSFLEGAYTERQTGCA